MAVLFRIIIIENQRCCQVRRSLRSELTPQASTSQDSGPESSPGVFTVFAVFEVFAPTHTPLKLRPWRAPALLPSRDRDFHAVDDAAPPPGGHAIIHFEARSTGPLVVFDEVSHSRFYPCVHYFIHVDEVRARRRALPRDRGKIRRLPIPPWA
ncbi:hypothetical protein BO71DRAFT_483664 [Aspergillus ellipticus CBS 707.79]|uniref:Uncharacterized protein n=1 Tax=Aspergillus ellipticus CBS 707.79 TaxID=1448320 RepID=A0A319DB61_9EURO|nr:hypothetical protein BO71DRAFT_483664 [Aspergillus ellipticus CBS 707.79]